MVDPRIPGGWFGEILWVLFLGLLLEKLYIVRNRKELDVTIERSNIRRTEFEGAKVSIGLLHPVGAGKHGGIMGAEFVVASEDCEPFFAQFAKQFPRVTARAYLEATR